VSNDESLHTQPDDAQSNELDSTPSAHFSGNLDSPWAIGQELNAEELFEQWSQQDELDHEIEIQKAQRFSVGRSPLLLVVVIIFSTVLAVLSFPALEALINRNHFDDCGDLSDYVQSLESTSEVQSKPYRHLRKCKLSSFVGTSSLFAIGRPKYPDAQELFKRSEGVSYVVKLHGDQVYAILPAHYPQVETYYRTRGDLAGLELTNSNRLNLGLIVDPEREPAYQALEREIRNNLGVKIGVKVWFFDVTYDPWDHKMPIIMSILGPLIALLALIALKNELQRRRRLKQADSDDEAWITAFEQGLQETSNEIED
jgi:hypothetical protein